MSSLSRTLNKVTEASTVIKYHVQVRQLQKLKLKPMVRPSATYSLKAKLVVNNECPVMHPTGECRFGHLPSESP